MNQPNAPSGGKRASLVVIVIVLLVAAGGFMWWSQETASSNVRKVVVAQAGDFFLYAPLYIAADAGFFSNLRLDVSLVSTGGDEKTWAAVIGGSASFGVADPSFVAIADSRGQQGRVIASIVNGVPFWGITFKKAIQPFTDPKALAPYSVATFPSPSTAYTLQKRMFIEAGLPPSIREGAFGTLIAMLKGDKADIALELEPNVSQAVSEGGRVLYSMPQRYGDFAITGLMTTPKILSTQTDVVRDVVCALQQALDYARKNPDESLQLLAKRFPEIKPDIAKAAFERVIQAKIIPTDVVVDAVAWDKAVALRTEVGDISNAKQMDAYVDNSFAKAARDLCRLK